MSLKAYSVIMDDIQSILGDNTVFSDAIMAARITEGLQEFSRYCPLIVRETFATTDGSKEIDISSIDNLLWIDALEFRTGREEREWRNFIEHYNKMLTMDIDFYPADVDSGIDSAEAMDASEVGMDCDADATDAIPVGTIIRVENELMYITAVSATTPFTLTVSRGYGGTTATTHVTDTDIMIPELAYIYCAKAHKIPILADIEGVATAAYTAGVITINIEGLTTSGTLGTGSTFTIASDGTKTHYTLIKDTVLSGGAGDLTFTPALAEDVAHDDVVTFDNSTLNQRQEILFEDLVAARAAISMSTKYINKVNVGSQSAWRDFLAWGTTYLAITLRKLEEEGKKYQKPQTIQPKSYVATS